MPKGSQTRSRVKSDPIPTHLSHSVRCQSMDPLPPDSFHQAARPLSFRRPLLRLLLIRSSSNSSRPAIRHPPVGCRIGRRRRHPHLQPRSLMRAVIFISSSGGPFPSEWTSSSSGRAGSTKTPTSSGPPLPFSVVSSSFGPPVSLTVGVVTYHRCIRHQAEHGRNIPAPIMTTSPSKIIDSSSAVMATTTSSSTTVTTPAGGSGGVNAPSAGLKDFAPLWSTLVTTPPITTVNSTLVALSLIPMVATMKQHIPGGIVNPEAFCDLCQNKIWNKYFLKRHKAKMHDIVPPNGSGTTTTFRLWLHPADSCTRGARPIHPKAHPRLLLSS